MTMTTIMCSKSFFFFTILILSILQLSTSQSPIEKTCKDCSAQDVKVKYDFCVAALQAIDKNQSASAANLKDMGMAVIRAINYNLTDTMAFTKQQLANPNLAGFIKSCMQTCSSLYEDSISVLKQAMDSYSSGQYYEANMQLSGVLKAATTCEGEFTDMDGISSPLAPRNLAISQLTGIVIYIMNIVQAGGAAPN